MMSELQMQKAKKVVKSITPVDDKTWVLPSSTNPKQTYCVSLTSQKIFTCNCRGYEYTHNCYHVMAIRIARGEF